MLKFLHCRFQHRITFTAVIRLHAGIGMGPDHRQNPHRPAWLVAVSNAASQQRVRQTAPHCDGRWRGSRPPARTARRGQHGGRRWGRSCSAAPTRSLARHAKDGRSAPDDLRESRGTRTTSYIRPKATLGKPFALHGGTCGPVHTSRSPGLELSPQGLDQRDGGRVAKLSATPRITGAKCRRNRLGFSHIGKCPSPGMIWKWLPGISWCNAAPSSGVAE